ncbi:N-acetylglucosamine kinase [Longispora albida]|uniref:N-acetylglucosamine kinase n=1 Tax=Longispora albida TaxID=203523 RepID=UPI000362A87F|nr:BadF/BadG/BcrA/BcrD ATPase family protein [Longispora albida]
MVVRHYVAVDGGNSKTEVLVGDTAGRVLARVRGGGSSPFHLGFDGSIAYLDKLVTEATAQAGVTLDRAELYLAGADLPHEIATLNDGAARAGWAAEIRLDNDTFALLRAGTTKKGAVAVVCGAGTNCVGVAADGRTFRFPALGELSGDWGGGHHLARMALWSAVRGEEGRGEPTALTGAVAAHFGRPTARAVAISVHLGEIDPGRLPELAPVLFTVADAGDPVALSWVDRQIEEVLAQARVAATALQLQDHDVVLGGGVLQSEPRLLVTGIRAGLPVGATPVIVTAPPVLGAALWALDALDAENDAYATLRGHFTLGGA